MSEYLTTGQMIDRLKVGEIAEGSTHWEVKKLPNGRIVELNSGDTFRLDISFLNEMWKIHPKYIKFEEAKKAYEAGKTVRCDFISAINPREKCVEVYNIKNPEYEGKISWYLITKGKWSIEE